MCPRTACKRFDGHRIVFLLTKFRWPHNQIYTALIAAANPSFAKKAVLTRVRRYLTVSQLLNDSLLANLPLLAPVPVRDNSDLVYFHFRS